VKVAVAEVLLLTNTLSYLIPANLKNADDEPEYAEKPVPEIATVVLLVFEIAETVAKVIDVCYRLMSLQ
jgi:hypothetical protein